MRRKNPNAVAGGRTAKFAGDDFEKWCEGQHAGARAMGVIAHVVHNQPAARVLGGRLTYEAKSGCDFTMLLVDGRTGAVEAKSASGRLARKAIRPLQVEQLDATARVGGLAFLLVEFRDGGLRRRFAVPWPDVPWQRLRSALSIGVEDMRPEWEVKPGECYLKRGVAMPAAPIGRRRVFARE